MKDQTLSLSGKKIVIVTHKSRLPVIPGKDLKEFALAHKCSSLLYITHPLLILKDSFKLTSTYKMHKKTKVVKTSQAFHWTLPEPLLMIKDILYTIFWVSKSKQLYDIYFGLNNLNALAGLVLKKLGRVKKVVYYTIDLYPERFTNTFINWIYHKVDQLCVTFCDETWNVSPFLVDYRKKKGQVGKEYSRQVTVPIGIWFDQMERSPWSKVKKNKITYVGHVKDFYGVKLAVLALPLIRKKIPNAFLEIVGGGEQLDELQKLAERLNVSSHITFHGWKDKKVAEHLISDAAVGIAPFNTQIDEKVKNADPAKIKDYLALGLPVVMTNASLNAEAIEKARCGIIIDYTPQSLSRAIIKLLSSETLQKEYRKNALIYVKQFDWNTLFTKNISRLL